jgi:hypothetical protein
VFRDGVLEVRFGKPEVSLPTEEKPPAVAE